VPWNGGRGVYSHIPPGITEGAKEKERKEGQRRRERKEKGKDTLLQ